MRKTVYLLLITVIAVAIGVVSCANNEDVSSYSQTGLVDQNGNVITNTLIYTNIVWATNNIDIWMTNGGISMITTNADGSIKIEYVTNILAPNIPAKATDWYNIDVPYAGHNYVITISYKDTNKLKQLWLDQIRRKGANDGKVFAIRNRANNRDVHRFQMAHDGRQDYYYFADNGDIYYKGGDINNKTGETLMKRFVGATIVDYRTVTKRSVQSDIRADDEISHTGKYTVGGIYKMAITEEDAKTKFADANGGATDGAYEFIAARRQLYLHYTPTYQKWYWFRREYSHTDFLEILVLNPYANEGNENCLGVDAYYAYYANGGLSPMIDESLYLGERPEYVIPLLTHTTTFTDASRWWSFLAMPGQKY